jgi:thioredoxin reductase (NADPH)
MPDFLTAEDVETLPKAKVRPDPEERTDVLVIGAGPTGLACAIEAQKIGLRVIVVDKGCLVNSLYHYPPNMLFFTTPELLEIGDIPFTTARQKPTREEDLANQLCIPGEDLPKVSHYYGDAHPYYDTDVLVIGGKNSAAIATLDLWRHGARVTLVYRGSQLHHHVKYWIKPDLENRIKNNEIEAYFNSTVQEIGVDHVMIKTPGGPLRLKNDFVLALIGYHPDYDFLRSMGIELSEDQHRPVCDPVSLESNVAGIYVAGVIVAGSRTNEIFIENGRFHGKQIAEDLRIKLRPE